MKKIDLSFEESLLAPYGITVEDIALANGYKARIQDESQLVSGKIPMIHEHDENGDPVYEQLPQTAEERAAGTPPVTATDENGDPIPHMVQKDITIDNPQTATAWVAEKLPVYGMQKMIERVMKPQVDAALREVARLQGMPAKIAAEVAAKVTKQVTE